MMQTARSLHYITEEEYLEMERSSEIKHEYYHGEIFAMSGASFKHNVIVSNIIGTLGNQLRKKPCHVLPSDMKLKVQGADRYVYPDIIVVCGEKKFFGDKEDVLMNATVIVEVLSDSTESYDRGDKFAYYRRLDGLKEYVLVLQKHKKLEKFLKDDRGYWHFFESDEDKNEMVLESIECLLHVDDVYEKVF
ncbi:MAG: Uma2 family endonuclease [Desulfobacterales bacterium]|nr:Uma2 family endonuclease [Desulfobacterales bacterium]